MIGNAPRVVAVLCLCLTGFIALALSEGTSEAANKKVTIAITPSTVVVGQPWHVVVSGLRPGESDIVLGNGYNDGNWMYHASFTADAVGNINVDPPILQFVVLPDGNILNPLGQHDFQVLRVFNNGGSQLLGDLWYEVTQAQ